GWSRPGEWRPDELEIGEGGLMVQLELLGDAMIPHGRLIDGVDEGVGHRGERREARLVPAPAVGEAEPGTGRVVAAVTRLGRLVDAAVAAHRHAGAVGQARAAARRVVGAVALLARLVDQVVPAAGGGWGRALHERHRITH